MIGTTLVTVRTVDIARQVLKFLGLEEVADEIVSHRIFPQQPSDVFCGRRMDDIPFYDILNLPNIVEIEMKLCYYETLIVQECQ